MKKNNNQKKIIKMDALLKRGSAVFHESNPNITDSVFKKSINQ